MRLPDKVIYLFYLFFFALPQFGLVRPQCPAVRIVSFDDIRPPTLTQPHCAVNHTNVTQTDDKKLTEYSVEKSTDFLKEYACFCFKKL